MPTFEDPVNDADELRTAVRGLAHATRRIQDPSAVDSVLGSLSSALASLTQVSHQVGIFHDKPAAIAEVSGDPQAGRAATYRVSWELHHAAEIVHQAAEGVSRAHQVEATISYDIGDIRPAPARAAVHGDGLSL